MEKKSFLSGIKSSTVLMARRYFDHKVGKNSAALAYYLLFAMFPLMIFVSNLLGQLDLDIYSITHWLSNFMPHDVTAIFENYLIYVSENSSGSMLGLSLVFTLYFPFRAARSLILDVRMAYGLEKPHRPILFFIRQIIFTVLLFAVIAITLIFSTVGENVLDFIVARTHISIPEILISVWNYLRFFLIAAIMFVAIASLYAVSQDKRVSFVSILPGAMVSLICWIGASIGFSFYVENFAKYSVIYGALGTVIVLLLWLYITAVILIMGAELNQIITIKAEMGLFETQ